MYFRFLISALFAVFVGGAWLPAFAQEDANAPDAAAPALSWDNIETVIVHPPEAGPAMWHVKKGDSEIWLIGTITLMPKDMKWNDRGVADVISGAKKLYTPPEPDAGPASILWFALTHHLSLPDGQHVQDFLSPADQARLARDMAESGKTPKNYAGHLPQLTMMQLLAGIAQAHHWSQDADQLVEAHLSDIADDKDVDTDSLGAFEIMPTIRKFFALPPEKAAPCLVAALDDADAWEKNVAPEAEAWAVGDVAAMKAHVLSDRNEVCMRGLLPARRKIDQMFTALMRKAVKKALKTPGKTVMLLPVIDILANDGALKLLSDMGLTVEQVSTSTQ